MILKKMPVSSYARMMEWIYKLARTAKVSFPQAQAHRTKHNPLMKELAPEKMEIKRWSRVGNSCTQKKKSLLLSKQPHFCTDWGTREDSIKILHRLRLVKHLQRNSFPDVGGLRPCYR